MIASMTKVSEIVSFREGDMEPQKQICCTWFNGHSGHAEKASAWFAAAELQHFSADPEETE